MIDAITASRFWSKVDQRGPDECWPWLGKLYDGYGAFSYQNKNRRAHRWSAVFAGIHVPPKMHVDHICRNRSCVNPAHLRVVTPVQNTMENSIAPSAINAIKTHCIRGHILSGPNLRTRGTWRQCKECQKIHKANHLLREQQGGQR